MQALPAGVTTEVLIVDGGSTDQTTQKVEKFFETIDSLPVRVFASIRGRAVQMNCGAAFARGDVLLFLHADSTLSPNAISELVATLENPAVQYGYFPMNFSSNHPLAQLYAAATRINSILTHYGDSGIFARKEFFEKVGQFPEQELMEDVEFLFRARAISEPTLIRNAFVTTSARRFEKNGFLRQQLLNIYLVVQYIFGADVATLKAQYETGKWLLR